MAQIEGCMDEEGKKVILVEDLQTDGGSKKVFIDALREAGAIVEHSFVVFHYGILPKSEENNKAMGVKLHALTTWWAVLEMAKELKYFDPETIASVEEFLHAPINGPKPMPIRHRKQRRADEKNPLHRRPNRRRAASPQGLAGATMVMQLCPMLRLS